MVTAIAVAVGLSYVIGLWVFGRVSPNWFTGLCLLFLVASPFAIGLVSKSRTQKLTTVVAAAIGLCYGIVFRLLGKTNLAPSFFQVMSLGFLFAVPFAIGFVSVFILERNSRQRIFVWFLFPWLPIIAECAAVMLFFWEGLICILMFLPIGLTAGMLGGVLGGLCARYIRRSAAPVVTALLLPFLIAPWERTVFNSREIETARNFIDVNAPADTIWNNIERVPAIHPRELKPAWTQRIGFPRPVEATLSFQGVGAIRHATFEGGVLFIESIDVWQPRHKLSFTIRAQTDHIPRTTLDEHVTIGGPYFDILRGTYELESLPDGRTRLHLESQHRLSTDFNWYSRLWTTAVMSDIQKSILYVIKNRCEASR